MTTTGNPEFSRDELVAALDLDADHAERLWNAFGFARISTPDKIFTAAEASALRPFARAEEVMTDRTQIATARAIGQTMARLTDWQAELIRDLERDPARTWTRDQIIDALAVLQQLIWRRHLAMALDRGDAHDPDAAVDLVIGFVDIVGYTSLSRRLAMDELEDLLATFEEQTHEIVSQRGGQVIKTLGDAVMFTFDAAAPAADAALAIHRLSDGDTIPDLRVGLARGPVLTRLGDVFGEPVNIAARLCGSAYVGTTLIDEAIGDELAGDDRFYIRSIPALSVRGYRKLKARTLVANRRRRE
ncbi:MAG: adenylate/guanylate cyclase domain-containing protein [Gordonia sp. (in: high G+C Gram-positive bacteria)]